MEQTIKELLNSGSIHDTNEQINEGCRKLGINPLTVWKLAEMLSNNPDIELCSIFPEGFHIRKKIKI